MSNAPPPPGGDNPTPEAFERIYKQVRARAQKLLAEYRGHSLQGTDLANEAAVKILRTGNYPNDAALYAAVVTTMKNVLRDRYDKKVAQKRGGGRPTLSLQEAAHLTAELSELETLIALLDAEEYLRRRSPELADIFRRDMAGETATDIAKSLALPVEEIKKQLIVAGNMVRSQMRARDESE